MKRNKHFYTILILVCLLSCKKENMGDCFKSTGSIEEETRSIEAFSQLNLSDRIDVIIRYAPETSLRVEAGENLQKHIRTEVKQGTLFIENNNTCNWVRSFKPRITVYLSTPNLKAITYQGSGNVTFENTFLTDTLQVELWEASGNLDIKVEASDLLELKCNTGTVTVTCEGTAKAFVSFMRGHGFIDAGKTVCNRVLAVNENTGYLTVNALDFLQADIKSTGNVYYKGNPPTIELNDIGKGNLIALP